MNKPSSDMGNWGCPWSFVLLGAYMGAFAITRQTAGLGKPIMVDLHILVVCLIRSTNSRKCPSRHPATGCWRTICRSGREGGGLSLTPPRKCIGPHHVSQSFGATLQSFPIMGIDPDMRWTSFIPANQH
ncbi:hypothetical protein QBC35DRAFT_297676 [Podospora australis]|uniref:Uncharacterized protein n=1 Tax=Podospora australis TaxID=1536484 RepID=A0AAN6WPJ0_9PEZI|nr:hypothetical protein QBC35DRAFT_297676 [Podospora australis]